VGKDIHDDVKGEEDKQAAQKKAQRGFQDVAV
jgi:hypothetical protein